MEVIDWKDGMERVQDDSDLFLELTDIFREDFPGKYAALQKAVKGNDRREFQTIIHGIKGATGNISAAQMHANCVELDAQARNEDILTLAPGVDLLGRQFDAFVAEANRLKDKHSRGEL
ncbi:MAG: Hpt domain-containing protein [Candidatus Omnitrophota bacterium]